MLEVKGVFALSIQCPYLQMGELRCVRQMMELISEVARAQVRSGAGY